MESPAPVPAPSPWGHRIVRLLTLAFLLALFAANAFVFRVPEGFAVVVTRFGRPIQVQTQPGPGWRLPPPVDQIRSIDCRKQVLDTPAIATLTRDKKNILVSTYVVWHIDDPLRFVQAVGTSAAAASQLAGMVAAVQTEAVAQVDLSALVSITPSDIRTSAITEAIASAVDTLANQRLGVAIDRVGFQRISLPEDNVPAVLERMRSERETEAGRVRSEGARAAQAIRDAAHVESQEILRKGREEAGRITADAEREAGRLFALAHEQAPEFYAFWSSLQASKKALGKNATLILRSDQAFFGALLDDSPPPIPAPAESASPIEEPSR